MEIVVCVKPVPDPETRLRSSPDGTTLDIEAVKFVLAGYDESAVEQALLLKEATPGSKVHVVSAGPPPRTEEVLRASLALGCDSATWVEMPPGAALDPTTAARSLARGVAALPHDLVLVGKQAGDDEAGVVGAALAELLGVPDFSAVVDLRWDAAASRLRFQRSTDLGTEVWEAPLPCVVALQQAWNDPRTAKLPAILKSRKQPITKVAAEPAPAGAGASRPAKFELPPPRTGAKLIDFKTPEEAAQKLVKALQEEAKVFP
ncbi:MAG TPA: electron transfer flavoprotein subunit beta/FixA family protein [Thermoplasmata archaeon]|jgi:electron transfer flavoprotein beta subunit|nr:electron transfer flavoprotein subunit beta/FixA family protein [Thermoplasmata archaeon]